jgi:hypothetical protein
MATEVTPTHRPDVVRGEPARCRFEIQQITETAGCIQTGGTGASCWGFNQSNLVRHGDQVYALSWRDDLSLTVYRRAAAGEWEASPRLPETPQNGNLLIDRGGRVHVISGANACYHAVFDPPGQVHRFTVQRLAAADSRFGAAIDERDRILVVGGLESLVWYVLDPRQGYVPAAQGRLQHPAQRGYSLVVFGQGAAHAFCSDDYFQAGEAYPNQTVRYRELASGQMKTVVTPRGIYPVLRTYWYHNPDLLAAPDDWRVTVVSDVTDTATEVARGTTEQQDLLVDRQGLVHLVYFENRDPSTTVWAGEGQDQCHSRLYHAVGRPGGPLAHWCLGDYTSGRLFEGLDGRFHYLLTRGRRGQAEQLWYAAGEAGSWSRISAPVRLDLPSRFWHLFVSTTRAGGTGAAGIDCYWTGAYQHNSQQVWHGWLQPEG